MPQPDRLPLLGVVLRRLPGGGVDTSPTGLYALGTRLATAGVLFGGGLLVLVLFDPGRIGVFMAVTALTGFVTVIDLGLAYSLLLAVSSRPAADAERVAWAAFKVALPTVPVAGTALFLGGSWLLARGDVAASSWFWPWLAFCALACVQIVLMLGLTFAEGSGRRREAWRANFWIEILAGLVLLAAIAAGQELWALAASVVARIVLTSLFLALSFDLPKPGREADTWALWRAELWPMQWKTLVNLLTGLLTTRLLTPLLLAAQGAVVAGQVGLILSLAYLLVATASVLPLSQSGLYARLFHERRGGDLRVAFGRTFALGFGIALISVAGAGLACVLLAHYSPFMAARLPEAAVIWLVLASAPVGYAAACFAIVLRSQRRDPGAIPNLILTGPILALLVMAAGRDAVTFAAVHLATVSMVASLYSVLLRRFLRSFPREG